MLVSSIAKPAVLRSLKTATRIVSCLATLLFLSVASSADICVLKVATVSQIRGQAKHSQEALGGIPVQLWGSDRRGGKKTLVAESETDSSGHFSFTGIPSGSYRLTFPLPGFDGDDFLIHLKGRNLFRWYPSNWLQVELGIVSMHCPATNLAATREKTKLTETK